MKYVTHLVYGDAHTAPYQDLIRFTWLGFYCAMTQPDWVIDLGDHTTFDSCSFFDVPRLQKSTLRDDVDASIEARNLFQSEIDKHNNRQRRLKKATYKPKRAYCAGNHEYRLLRRMAQDEDVLGSLVDLYDLLMIPEHFDVYCGYREYLEIDGILYTHAVPNGRNQPISGVTRGRTIAMSSSAPVVYGHTHKFDYTSVPLIGNTNSSRWSLNIPCFMDHQHVEEYAKESTTGWNYGVVELKIYEDGHVTYNWISMEELKRFYEENN